MWQCPGCAANDPLDDWLFSLPEVTAHFVRPWVEPVRFAELSDCIRSLWGTNQVALVRCGACGLRSANPFVAGNAKFYALAYGRESFHSYPGWRWEYQLTREAIPKSGTVLEIGAGDGAFQRGLIGAGISPSRLYATEYSAIGRDALESLGVSVTSTDLRELPPAGHAVVCGHQVFEHLDDLDGVFRAFDSLTAPKGIVALSVPNGATIARTEASRGEIDMPPNHVSTWQKTAFQAAGIRRGWKIVDYREEPASRLGAAKSLAKSKVFRSRQKRTSLTARLEQIAPSADIRYGLMALSAAAQLPAAYLKSSKPSGGAIWVLMSRA